jgi:hypothetical protein
MQNENESEVEEGTSANVEAPVAATKDTPATKDAQDNPDSRRIKIRRVEHESGPATCIPYEDDSGEPRHWYPDPASQEFEVTAIIASPAVASGFFEESPDTKTRLNRRISRQ